MKAKTKTESAAPPSLERSAAMLKALRPPETEAAKFSECEEDSRFKSLNLRKFVELLRGRCASAVLATLTRVILALALLLALCLWQQLRPLHHWLGY